MKIEHTTYEEARSGWPTSRRVSTTTKVKDYFSRLTCGSDQPSPKNPNSIQARPATMWPRFQAASSDDVPEMTAYLTQKHRTERAAQEEEKTISKANITGKYLPLKELDANPPVRQTPTTTSPKLRHIGRLSDKVRDKLNWKSDSNQNSKTAQKSHDIEKLQQIQREIRGGKWERTVPPSHQPQHSGRKRWIQCPRKRWSILVRVRTCSI